MNESVVTICNAPAIGRVCDENGIESKREKPTHYIVKPKAQKIHPEDTMWIPYDNRLSGGYTNKNNGMFHCLDGNRPTAFTFVKKIQKNPSSKETIPSDIYEKRRDFIEDSRYLKKYREDERKFENTRVIVHTRKARISSNDERLENSLNNESEMRNGKLSTALSLEDKSRSDPIIYYTSKTDALDCSKKNHISNLHDSPTNMRASPEDSHDYLRNNLCLQSNDDIPVLPRLVYPYTGYYIPYDLPYTDSRNLNHNQFENYKKRKIDYSDKTDSSNIHRSSSEDTEFSISNKDSSSENKKEAEKNNRKTVISVARSSTVTDSFEHYRGSITEDANSRDESVSQTEDSIDSDEYIDVGVESDLVFQEVNHELDNSSDATTNEDEVINDKDKYSPVSDHIDDLTDSFTAISCERRLSCENNSSENIMYMNPYNKDSMLYKDKDDVLYGDSASQRFNRLTIAPDTSPPRRHLSDEYSKIAIHDEEERSGIFNVEDLMLRNRIIVILWVLLGEYRLCEVGFPSEPIHKILWRTVDICCSVAGMKSAAAIPLAPDHDCGHDMLCFRDHSHRFLEVCAPTRDLWKQFDWAGLTVDAVVRKIYTEEVKPYVRQLHSEDIPLVIQRAMVRMERLEHIQKTGGDKIAVASDTHLVTPSIKKPFPALTTLSKSNNCHPIVKKKRGRPAKASSKSDAGRIERVMLWRFLLNLLEDPRNTPCIHWVQREEGIFRIVNTDWLARLWGRRHGNPRMTYEKMARAMRTYYRSKVLQPVPRTRNLPRKLVYKFNPAVVRKVAAMRHLATTFTGRGMNYNTPATSTS